jgi:hypothetical protein
MRGDETNINRLNIAASTSNLMGHQAGGRGVTAIWHHNFGANDFCTKDLGSSMSSSYHFYCHLAQGAKASTAYTVSTLTVNNSAKGRHDIQHSGIL